VVQGQAVVAHTLDTLAQVAALAATLVVLSPEDEAFESHAPRFTGPRAWVARCGGPTRAASVAAGLAALRARGAASNDWVLVHDAARCLLQPAWVQRLIDACKDDTVGGLLALPLADTLKQAQGDRVAQTLSREHKWLAQTPQMFRLGLLEQALAAAEAGGYAGITDEASAIEAQGLKPLLVRGSAQNFKVTYPQDFALAQAILQSRVVA
jgi:2-C-methyl-D-erythritol 4-phosphate cytidylyltransferase